MDAKLHDAVLRICDSIDNDSTRLLDAAREIQDEFGYVPALALDLLSTHLDVPRVEVESLVSFYTFLSLEPQGKVVIRLCNDVVDLMAGAGDVGAALCDELGIGFGETTADGLFTLQWTSCIGLSDQAPAALFGTVPVTHLTPGVARQAVKTIRQSGDPKSLIHETGDGNNSHELVRSMVWNHLRREGSVVFGAMEPGQALRNALAMSPAEVTREVKTARLRGRGGAGFPTGMKWEFTRAADGDRKFVICNADEGEPGTFKDRVILTERPDLMFEGMTIAGYAIGAREAILYLRGEYEYLRAYLEHILETRREAGLLGKGVLGKTGFDFDIRIQLGAGAYICGEETSLITSCEGRRGDPKNRPPFPAQSGYLGCPTSVNNVETFCQAARIVEKGAGWYGQLGTQESPGTKLLSISGDCHKPGVFELPFGVTLRDVLQEVGADNPIAVQVGGPSGRLVAPAEYDRVLSFEDLSTGGSIMVFGPQRDIVDVVRAFMEFFVEESCGYCTPCRVGNVLMLRRLEEIQSGKGEAADIEYLQSLATTVKATSRCGLGQTSPNPVLSSLKGFRAVYESRCAPSTSALIPTFNIHEALTEASALAGRPSVRFADRGDGS